MKIYLSLMPGAGGTLPRCISRLDGERLVSFTPACRRAGAREKRTIADLAAALPQAAAPSLSPERFF